jgi:hypothetical protein
LHDPGHIAVLPERTFDISTNDRKVRRLASAYLPGTRRWRR